MASTAIKLAGGVSAKDAHSMAREMRAEPDFLQVMRKHSNHTEFCLLHPQHPPLPGQPHGPLGQDGRKVGEERGRVTASLWENARRYCAGSSEPLRHTPEP